MATSESSKPVHELWSSVENYNEFKRRILDICKSFVEVSLEPRIDQPPLVLINFKNEQKDIALFVSFLGHMLKVRFDDEGAKEHMLKILLTMFLRLFRKFDLEMDINISVTYAPLFLNNNSDQVKTLLGLVRKPGRGRKGFLETFRPLAAQIYGVFFDKAEERSKTIRSNNPLDSINPMEPKADKFKPYMRKYFISWTSCSEMFDMSKFLNWMQKIAQNYFWDEEVRFMHIPLSLRFLDLVETIIKLQKKGSDQNEKPKIFASYQRQLRDLFLIKTNEERAAERRQRLADAAQKQNIQAVTSESKRIRNEGELENTSDDENQEGFDSDIESVTSTIIRQSTQKSNTGILQSTQKSNTGNDDVFAFLNFDMVNYSGVFPWTP